MGTAYEKRTFYGLADWAIAGHALKIYGISAPDAAPLEDSLIDHARAFTELTLPMAADAEGGSERLGYCVLHRGTLGCWLLIHWWAHADICCQRLALAEPGSTRFVSMDTRPLWACVWEQVVLHHERQAWVRWMMSATPDPEGYRGDRLADGQY